MKEKENKKVSPARASGAVQPVGLLCSLAYYTTVTYKVYFSYHAKRWASSFRVNFPARYAETIRS